MSVVVARMMPSKVRKLRSLLPRNEPAATKKASRRDPRDCIKGGYARVRPNVPMI